MITHVLIACSKTKHRPVSKNLIWNKKTTIERWNYSWRNELNLTPACELYNGRAFQEQLSLCSQYKGTKAHILSAGAGLISDIEVTIPSYEATFQSGRGPTKANWKSLPLGGLNNLQLEPDDVVVSFAPPQYHQALLEDHDIRRIAPQLTVPKTSPLADVASSTLPIHARAKEVLGVADVDLNTAFLRTYLSEGVDGFHNIISACDNLPPKVNRRRVSDDELLEILNGADKCKTLDSFVRHLRDDLKIAASIERISEAMKILSEK
jgi:hypothetical protein